MTGTARRQQQRRRYGGRGAAVAAVVALAATGCGSDSADKTGTTAAESPAASPSMFHVKHVSDASLTKFTGQKLSWSDCKIPDGVPADAVPPGLQCAKATVPLDYAKPDGETYEVGVSWIPATVAKDKRRGVLFVNPGGPGGSAKEMALGLASVAPQAAEAYDVIGMDPRGVGDSGQVHCLDGKGNDALYAVDQAPTDQTGREALRKQAKLMADACEAKAGKLLPYIGTENVARDMDVVRAALGEKKLTYAGISYGTLLGQYYAEQYPDRFERMFLDSVMNPELSLPGIIEQTAVSFQKSYDAFLADCAKKGAACPLGTDAEAAGQKVTKLVADLNAKPLAGVDKARPVSGSDVLAVLTDSLSKTSSWPQLATDLAAGTTGKVDGLRLTADTARGRSTDGTYDGSVDAFTAVACTFASDADRSDAALDAAIAKATKASALFGPIDSFRPCASWPTPSAAPAHEIKTSGTAPIVVANNIGDPSTPLSWAEAAAADLGGSVLVKNTADSHGYMSSGACTVKVFEDYLVAGTLPKAGNVCHDSGAPQQEQAQQPATAN